MENNYNNLINSFGELIDSDKRKIIIEDFNELLVLLYRINKTYNINNEVLPIINDYNNESEYLNVLYTRVISLKEEVAKLIQKN